nr:uncharacterized protein LOC106692982 isoform X2 [Halyomorpha halys]
MTTQPRPIPQIWDSILQILSTFFKIQTHRLDEVIWLDHQYFRFISDRSPDFQNALKINRTILSNMVLDDLREYIRDKNVYYYPPKETVLTLDESYNLIRLILTQQMTAYQLSEFLHNVYLMLNHRSGKHNCILIKGIPSVGKTWFANLLGKLMINTGYIGNSNRYNQFPFQDCPRRNLLIFDEPNVEPSSYENFKLLFAGIPLSANIKYESQNLVNRTPVIVCCNSDPFPHNPEFNSRIYRYTWNTRIDSILTNIKDTHTLTDCTASFSNITPSPRYLLLVCYKTTYRWKNTEKPTPTCRPSWRRTPHLYLQPSFRIHRTIWR